MTVAVLGATGYTGRLIVEELVRRGVETVAVGRDRAKLERLGVPGRVADASDAGAVRDAVDGCRAAVSCVGPFVDLGEPVLRGIVEAGVHYCDTTGEQAFMRRVFEGYADAPVAVVPAIGFDYVPGDMAAALAARALGRTPERVEVTYRVRHAKSSDGTKRTGLRVMALPCLVVRDGRLVERPIGSEERTFAFPDGESHVALWPGGEPITVPRHTGAREVSVFMRMPKVMASMARKARLAEPLAKAGRAVLDRTGGGPSEEDRTRGTYTVVADAVAGDERARCVVEGHDMYGMTAVAVAEALERMTGQDFDRTGALAPAEAFEPEPFLQSLRDFLTFRLD